MNEIMSVSSHQLGVNSQIVKKENSYLASVFVRNAKKQAIKLNLQRRINLKQFKENIYKRMGMIALDQAIFLHGKQLGEDKQEIELFDGLIFHAVNLKRVNIPQIHFTVRRIQPNSVSYPFLVDSKTKIHQFLQNRLSLHYSEVHNYFLVYTGRQLKNEKCFQDQFVEDGCQLLAVHKIQNRKNQSMVFKKDYPKKAIKEKLKKHQKIKIHEATQDDHKKREKQSKTISDQHKSLLEVQKRQGYVQNLIPEEPAGKKENNIKLNQVSQSREQDQQSGTVAHQLYQTAKFNSVEEIKDKGKNHKQIRLQERSILEQKIELEETQQIIIGNYNALSFNQEKNTSEPSVPKEEKQPLNNQILTRYGLVPKKQSNEFNREIFETPSISQSELAEIVAIQVQPERDPLYAIAVQYIGNQKEVLGSTENSPDKRSLKSSFSPSLTQMTLKTISSHYDQEMNSSTKSKAEEQNADEESYNQSLVYDNANSIRYKNSPLGKPEKKNQTAQKQVDLYQSNRESGQDCKVSFFKKSKMQMKTLGELPFATEQKKMIQVNDINPLQDKGSEKQLAQTVDPAFFHSYQNQQGEIRSLDLLPQSEEVKFSRDSRLPESAEQPLDQSQIKIHLQDSDVILINGRNKIQDEIECKIKETVQLNEQQKKREEKINESESLNNESEVQVYLQQKKGHFNQSQSYTPSQQARMSTGQQEVSKKYPHTSNISQVTSIYQTNFSDCPPGDQQEILNRFPQFYQMNMRNSFTSDIEESISKWEIGRGNSAGVIQSALFSEESQNYPDQIIYESQTKKLSLEENIARMNGNVGSSPSAGFQQDTQMKNIFQQIERASIQQQGQKQSINKNIQNIKNNPKENYVNRQDSLLLQDSATADRVVPLSQSLNLLNRAENGETQSPNQETSPVKLEQEDDNLLNYVLNSSEKFTRKKQFAYFGTLQNSLPLESKSKLCSEPQKSQVDYFNFSFSNLVQKQKIEPLKIGDFIMIGDTRALQIVDQACKVLMAQENQENIVQALRSSILLEFYELQQRPKSREKRIQEMAESQKMQASGSLEYEKKQEQDNLLLEYL